MQPYELYFRLILTLKSKINSNFIFFAFAFQNCMVAFDNNAFNWSWKRTQCLISDGKICYVAPYKLKSTQKLFNLTILTTVHTFLFEITIVGTSFTIFPKWRPFHTELEILRRKSFFFNRKLSIASQSRKD